MVATLAEFGQDVGAYYVYLYCTIASKDGVEADFALRGSTVGSFCALVKDVSAHTNSGFVRGLDLGFERGTYRGQDCTHKIEGVDSGVSGGTIGELPGERLAVHGGGNDVGDSWGDKDCGFLERVGRMLGSGGAGVLCGSTGDVLRDAGVGDGLKDEVLGSVPVEVRGGLSKTELNRLSRQKAKERKARKKARQSLTALSSRDWNADKVACASRGYFSSCADDIRKKLVDTRARRLTVENELRVKEMELKMSTIKLQEESRFIERKVENDRMKMEIEARKAVEQMPGGSVETVISSGSISPNSSISVAAVNKLQKDLADANEKLRKSSGSGAEGIVMSSTERELRLANFELESMRLEEKSFKDYTFTDEDYKISLQALRDEYADVLLSDGERIAREAARKVMDILSDKIDDEAISKIAALGYIDIDTIAY